MYRRPVRKDELQNAVPEWVLRGMKKHPSFHGSMTRTEAAKELIEFERSCYLTRYSEYNKSCVISVLTVTSNGDLLQHLKLDIPRDHNQTTYRVAGTEIVFPTC